MDLKIVEIVKNLGLKSRIKPSFSDEASRWDTFLIMPVPGYLEGTCGPVPDRDVEWIDIDPIVLTRKGKLVPDMKEDKRDALIKAFVDREIKFEDMGEFIRVR